MADIGKYGGMITVTADTTPTGHNITTNSIPAWCCGATAGSVWTCEVLPNTESDRTGEISVQITTNESGDYDPTSISEVRTFSFTQAGPPTPITPTFHMSNSSNVYGLYGQFTITATGGLPGDWSQGTSRDMYLDVPFNITEFSGAVSKGSTLVSWPNIVRFTIGSNYYDMSVSVNPSDEGVVNWTGTIPISQDDNVVISFL